MASKKWSVALGWRGRVDEFSVSVIVTRWLFQ
jgi:hypothetical protein